MSLNVDLFVNIATDESTQARVITSVLVHDAESMGYHELVFFPVP